MKGPCRDPGAGVGADGWAPSLRTAAAEARERARETGERQWLALRRELSARSLAFDPLRVFDVEAPHRFYWERDAGAEVRVASGVALAIEGEGAGRFAQTSAALRRLRGQLVTLGDPAPAEAGPCWVGGFSFAAEPSPAPEWSKHPPARLVLPEVLVVRTGGRAFATVVASVGPGDDPEAVAGVLSARIAATERDIAAAGLEAPLTAAPLPSEPDLQASAAGLRDYQARVRRALDAIAAGRFEKVVVARSIQLETKRRVDERAFLATLRSTYPSCVTFAIGSGDDVLLGATPERLVELHGDRVTTGAVAGSARRGSCRESDDRLARALRESKKEQAEHAVVVGAIRRALEPLCGTLDGPETPRVLRVEGIQHLETPLSGRLLQRDGSPVSIVDLVERLHPTPAVGGQPREAAVAWLDTFEGLERGGYAGPVGFVDIEGSGEFRVALRSGLLRHRAGRTLAHLFAGSGIVAGSEPEREFGETRLKLRALLGPLVALGADAPARAFDAD